LWDDRSVG